MKRLLLIVPLLSIACGDSPDPETPTPTDEATATPSPTPTATADPASREHCGDITADEVWTAGSPHTITCTVTIKGGSVTIEPGTTVLVDGGGLRFIVSEGDLTTQGAETSPVTFRPSGDNQWYGIRVDATAGDVSLSHTLIEGGIQQGGTIDNNSGALVVNDIAAHIDHLTVDGGTDCGVVLRNGGSFTEESLALKVSGVDEYPVCAGPYGAGSIPGVATGTDLTGNGLDLVNTSLDGGDLNRSSSWADIGIPYYVYGPLLVEGTGSSPAILTLEAGVEIRFRSTGYLQFSRYGTQDVAGFRALGTEAEPILLAGYEGVSRGSWGGILAYGLTDFELHYTHLLNGGSANNGALNAWEVGPLVDHVVLEGSAGWGFSLIDNAAFQEGSNGLEVHNSAKIGRVYGNAVGSIPEAGIDLSGNDLSEVSVEGKGGPVEMTKSATWGDIGVDYKMVGNMDLQGTASNPTILTLEPGVEISFADARYIGIGGVGAAALYAVGTAEAPIVFKSADSFTAGSWAALYFSEDTMADETRLEHIDLGYAGSPSFYRRQGGIIVDKAHVTINNSYIHDVECNGIAIYGETGRVTMDASTMTFEDNGCGDVVDENEPQASRAAP